jgi:hypothetical protein
MNIASHENDVSLLIESANSMSSDGSVLVSVGANERVMAADERPPAGNGISILVGREADGDRVFQKVEHTFFSFASQIRSGRSSLSGTLTSYRDSDRIVQSVASRMKFLCKK